MNSAQRPRNLTGAYAYYVNFVSVLTSALIPWLDRAAELAAVSYRTWPRSVALPPRDGFACLPSAASVTLKCLPHEKSARGKIITDLICLPLLKYRPPHKKSLIGDRSRQVSLVDNLRVKIRLARAAAGWGGFLPVNCQPGKTFLGDLIVGHRPMGSRHQATRSRRL